jgi:hypothetical protein
VIFSRAAKKRLGVGFPPRLLAALGKADRDLFIVVEHFFKKLARARDVVAFGLGFVRQPARPARSRGVKPCAPKERERQRLLPRSIFGGFS